MTSYASEPPPASPEKEAETASPSAGGPSPGPTDEAKPSAPAKDAPLTDYLRALSLKQPFCSALVLGKRKQESRTWKIKLPHDGSGLWVAAHSPAKASPATDPGMATLRQMWPDMPSLDQLPRSSIVGFLHVANVVPIEEFPVESREPGCTGPFVWVIDRTIPLETPFHCAGALGMWAPPKDLPVPDEVMTHCQSEAVLAVAPVPRKAPAAKPAAAAGGAAGVDEEEGGEPKSEPTAKPPPKPRKRAKTDASSGAAALEVAAPPNGAGPSRGGSSATPRAGGAPGAGAVGGPLHGLHVVAQLPTTPRLLLKVKPLGEQYYREVRMPLPSGYERLVALVARKLQIPPSSIERLVRLPDVLVADDSDVSLLTDRAELVAYLQAAD